MHSETEEVVKAWAPFKEADLAQSVNAAGSVLLTLLGFSVFIITGNKDRFTEEKVTK